MILDEVKLNSDDAQFNEDHILFLVGKYRALVLKQRYSDVKKQIPESNYQTICLDLEKSNPLDGGPCDGGMYLKTTEKVPTVLPLGNPQIYPRDYYQGDITYIARERMRYVGYNKYLGNIIYASIAPDGYLYLKSRNPQFLYLKKINFTGIFEDAEQASDLECDGECDIMKRVFPLEDGLIPVIIEMCVREISGAAARPEDTINDSTDTLTQTPSQPGIVEQTNKTI